MNSDTGNEVSIMPLSMLGKPNLSLGLDCSTILTLSTLKAD